MKQPRILFLSALDFKERSIQVIRITPTAYADAGWMVHYVVARDTCSQGNYFYEREIDIPGATIERFPWPLKRVREAVRRRTLQLISNKIAGWLASIKLARRAARILREQHFDVIYGYEIHGVLAVRLLRLMGFAKKMPVVSRFQGTWLTEIIKNKHWARFLANIDHVIAIRSPCDLCIMTDDGTRGDFALTHLKSPATQRRFWTNGTDIQKKLDGAEERRALGISNTLMLVSVSRLEAWKRVDRNLAIARELKSRRTDFVYFVVGDGAEKAALQRLVGEYGLDKHVRFVGALPHSEVARYLSAADVFLSMYDLSNVGNPLLEAIRAGKVIATLNNGDTGSWITHQVNGLIYSPDKFQPEEIARDICELHGCENLRSRLLEGVKELEARRLWTWEERMEAEIQEVGRLVQ